MFLRNVFLIVILESVQVKGMIQWTDTTIVLFRGMESSFYGKKKEKEKKNDSVFCLFFFLKISHGNFSWERPGRASGARLRLRHCSLGQRPLWNMGLLTTSFILHSQPGHSKVACANAGHPSCHNCKYNQVNLTTDPCQDHSGFSARVIISFCNFEIDWDPSTPRYTLFIMSFMWWSHYWD